MVFLKWLTILVLIESAFSRDFIRDALGLIDRNVDPCDDFYRHVCPKSSNRDLYFNTKYKPVFAELISRQKDRAWENSEAIKALNNIHRGEIEQSAKNYVLHTFKKICEEEKHLKEPFLSKLLGQSAHALSKDDNCTRVVELLTEHHLQFDLPLSQYLDGVMSNSQEILDRIRATNIILDGDYRDGVKKIKEIIDEYIAILDQWIEATPWVKNANVTEVIEEVANALYLDDNYGLELREHIDRLMENEQTFLNCSLDLEGKYDLFCLVFLYLNERFPDSIMAHFGLSFNAFNEHPLTAFSIQLHALAHDTEEMAAMLGSVGWVAGHELSHSLIEDPNKQVWLPVSSQKAIDCIQKQYNNTCNEFKEDSCEVTDQHIDENGADILGIQLAYQLFEDYYQDGKQDIYLNLNSFSVTYQQLFFYSAALNYCSGINGFEADGIHSADNIRANVLAQHPAFQEAFHCASDSRMMKTVEEHCAVYGEKAPEVRRKKV